MPLLTSSDQLSIPRRSSSSFTLSTADAVAVAAAAAVDAPPLNKVRSLSAIQLDSTTHGMLLVEVAVYFPSIPGITRVEHLVVVQHDVLVEVDGGMVMSVVQIEGGERLVELLSATFRKDSRCL